MYCTKEIRACSICHLNQKILPLDKLINQQEGILAYKVINGTYLLGDILTDSHELLDHYQLRNYENLYPSPF